MLALTIGEPPTQFTYAHRNKDGKAVGEPKPYTPQEFFKEVVGDKLNGTFIMVMNDPHLRPHLTKQSLQGHFDLKLDRQVQLDSNNLISSKHFRH